MATAVSRVEILRSQYATICQLWGSTGQLSGFCRPGWSAVLCATSTCAFACFSFWLLVLRFFASIAAFLPLPALPACHVTHLQTMDHGPWAMLCSLSPPTGEFSVPPLRRWPIGAASPAGNHGVTAFKPIVRVGRRGARRSITAAGASLFGLAAPMGLSLIHI